ncbi:MAG: hypothetical protein HW414_813 [Dehalococcoidia bacterium]|nr:hypothetical protein [Dehalococcoidia bacterium]
MGSVFMKAIESTHPTVCEFIMFCAERRGREWLPLYDEMCRVASRRFFKGLGYTELRNLGLFLGLTELDHTAALVTRTLSQV